MRKNRLLLAVLGGAALTSISSCSFFERKSANDFDGAFEMYEAFFKETYEYDNMKVVMEFDDSFITALQQAIRLTQRMARTLGPSLIKMAGKRSLINMRRVSRMASYTALQKTNTNIALAPTKTITKALFATSII